jgi:hypothetical protein
MTSSGGKPDGYWTRARGLASAKAFSTPTEWRRATGGARAAAVKNGWYDEATAHMTRIVGSRSWKWTKQNVLADAKKYSSNAEWRKASKAYSMAHRQGWLDEACRHMDVQWKAKWDKAAVLDNASRFSSRSAWETGSSGAYASALRNGWYEEATAHMPMLIESWTKEKVLEDAKRFATRGEWFKGSSSYSIAQINGWIEEASLHMIATLSLGELVIYTYLLEHDIEFTHQKRFDDLRSINKLPFDFHLPTLNLVIEYHGIQHRRGWGGNKDDALAIQRRDAIKARYAKRHGIGYVVVEAESREGMVAELERALISAARVAGVSFDPTQVRRLTRRERDSIAYLGSLTKEEVLASASRFPSITDWKRDDEPAYNRALRMGWKDEAVTHMIRRIKPSGYWTREQVIESAQPYRTQVAWKDACGGAWSKAVRIGWIDAATAHMPKPRPSGYWTKDRILASAKGFRSITEWQASEPSAPVIARREGWMADVRKAMGLTPRYRMKA